VKVLLSTPDLIELTAAKLALENSGIQCEVLNDGNYQNMPGPFAYPQLWVLDDSEFERASEIVKAARSSPVKLPDGDWVCPKRGERSEAQFVSCWKCGETRPDIGKGV